MALDLKPTEAKKKSYDRVALVQDFLNQNYDIKINVFDPSKTIIEAKNKDLFKQFAPTINEISLHMESENIRGCDGILKKILVSPNFITTFNPITDYLNALDGQWKGESHIDKMCSCIKVRDFGDKSEGYYQERFKRILKKWMVASIANSLGVKENDAMIGFIHADEGIGKTRLVKYLLPPVLKAYYRQSEKGEKNFNLQAAFTQNFIINFDEFHGITRHNAENVKQTLSALEFVLSLRDTNAIARMGNGAFTSNKTKEMGGFLYPNMGYRRWACIELDSIDWRKYITDVDIDQMWAEAYVLFKNADYDYVWNSEDFNEFQEYNRRYLIETKAYQLVNEYYRIPTDEDKEEDIHFVQAQDILRELRQARKITSAMNDVSEVTIGLALRALGYERKGKKIDRINSRYGYNVVKLL